jgi:hypothetical protein
MGNAFVFGCSEAEVSTASSAFLKIKSAKGSVADFVVFVHISKMSRQGRCVLMSSVTGVKRAMNTAGVVADM